MESAIITLFMECIASDRRLILIDDIDILVPENGPSTSASDLYSSSALIYGIDSHRRLCYCYSVCLDLYVCPK